MKVHHRNLPRVVIIGGGFGGLAAAQALAHAPVRVTLLDRQNHHLFQPLLYQVATAALSPADIAEPLRHILRRQENTEVLMTEVQRIHVETKQVQTADGLLDYDYLIVAAGARHSYFGHAEWEAAAPGLKSLDDALSIRRKMLTAFEFAEKSLDAELRKAALTFVVIGAGPTGVEMAGAIAEIARLTLVRDFRHIDSSQARVILLDAAPRVLPVYPPDLSENARRQLEHIGVEFRPGAIVEDVQPDRVRLKGGETIATHTIVWAAGNAAAPIGASLSTPIDRSGRVIVREDLTIPGRTEVQVIGDLAHFVTESGESLPGLAPVATQQGRHAARNIRAQIAGGWTSKFAYVDKGSMATIGRHAAVAQVGDIRFGGLIAWLAWLFIHLIFLVGFRNKVMVLINWAYVYFTYGRNARLITGHTHSVPQAAAPALQPPEAK